MVQSVEVVLDATLDAAVRAEWAALSAAGLAGQADHRGPSNAPHVTLAAVPSLGAGAEARLLGLEVPVGATVRLGGFLVFPGRRLVLSRTVVPDARLLALQADVRSALADVDGLPATFGAGAWTPHVTLSRRLDATTLGPALAALEDAPRELVGTVAGVRRWDGDARRTWSLPA